MSESRHHFVFELSVLLCCISFQNVSACGIKIMLTRDESGDFFQNPYATSADDNDETFCLSSNATCFKDHPKQHDKCRYCKCDEMKTFNETSLRCAPLQDFQKGCETWLSNNNVKLLDLTENGQGKLKTDSDEDVKSLRIVDMKFNFFQLGEPEGGKDNRWKVIIKWRKVSEKIYHGQVFKVQISYEINDDSSNFNKSDCFVFRSKGSIPVTIPDLTKTTLLPSTSEKSTFQTSPSHMVSHSAVTIPTLTTAAPSPSAIEKLIAQISSSLTVPSTTTTTASPTKIPLVKNTDPFNSTNKARKKESSDGEHNAPAVSLAVVGCLLLLGVILTVLWCRRRSARTSQDKKNTESSMANGNVEDPMVMSQVESSQTEAGNSKNSSEVGEVDHEYYNAEGDVQNYASLDMTKVESKPIYESLINVERNLYENIPSKEKTGNDNPERISNMP